ncbi:uncharacterized protein TRAVEDRAFT_25057 [Trametes versicolor FP-101664 SS1]|uniref:Uncharacterized protein n=1 Tax=Trametes versicolor (strain FP-101664) TaxID=717944 RepID=R7S6Q8_TRAVS|nr:uncharacterized protein TRAVEDRAFT_25057 [Trametes versicolor FP-101664 SS1]EIW51566.1 hypothetical protein TRAVEDRAFT_25057 [Trametes versicolor FP-101664 SS1]
MQQPHPQVLHTGPPRWDGPGMPPSISNDPFRIYPNMGPPMMPGGGYPMHPGPMIQGYSAPPGAMGYTYYPGPQGYGLYPSQGYSMSQAPQTTYAKLLYGPAVMGVPGGLGL